VKEVAVDDVPSLDVDVVLFQHRDNWLVDQEWLLSEAQRRGPRVYLEHDPPRENPTDTRHVVSDPGVLVVHVTHFNRLMWDGGAVPTRVIEHGVSVAPGVRYTGELAKGIAVVNNLASRGRRLGVDVFLHMRDEQGIPLDLLGMGSTELGGLGEVGLEELPALIGRYRFFFNPIRYTSLGLAVCEAMAVGVPIVGLATTEMVRVVENGVSGFIDTDLDALSARMRRLLADPELAHGLGQGARRFAQEKLSIERFTADWLATLEEVAGRRARTTGTVYLPLVEVAA
jgi:hypothetical protein